MALLIITTLVFTCLWSSVSPDDQGNALFALRSSLRASPEQLSDWNQNQVDPCTWSQVICDDKKHVTSVTLSYMNFSLGTLSSGIGILTTLKTLTLKGNGITGGIPESIGNLSSLTSLDLEDNQLTGRIPSTLGNLKNLQFLTLSRNNLNGTIPDSLTGLSKLINILLDSNNLSGEIPQSLFKIPKYNFTANNLSCGGSYPQPCVTVSNPSGDSSSRKTGIIAGVVSGVAVILLGFFFFFFCKDKHKGYKRDVFVDVAGEVDRRIAFGQLRRFAWRELQLATDEFSEKNVLGQGGFGKVYKGLLSDGTKVAVKRLTDFERPGGDEAFQREVEMISVAVHRNLLRLIGFCTTQTERLLVYPFMQNLSVAYCLREIKPGDPILDWFRRKQIALGAARGLEYLHEHCNPKIIHRDVKAANVLLDEDFEAVLVTGQRAIDFSRLEEEDDVLLLDHVKKLEREKRLGDIVDKKLGEDYIKEEVEMMIQVALLCTQAAPEERPAMSEVVRMLEGEGLAERWEEWQNLEVTRQEEFQRLQRRFDWGEDSINNQDAIELSGGR
ncbi:unnamed protein product [Arabidopsis arenosa]|uniref:non-specific serine/threonine protein kinase n=1 Tax=Arabidopsis arenosa TaxID=38785 RepID=A0A8S2B7R3_ARAAE|nr:unnamed protein product [Arabidopsis arenosa]